MKNRENRNVHESSAAPSALARRIRQQVNGKPHDFFAIVTPGFESIARRELRSLGIEPTEELHHGGIAFTGRLDDCFRVNLASRTVSRLLMRVARFRTRRFDEFREAMAALPWELYCSPGMTVAFTVTSHASALYHTGRLTEECRAGVSRRLAAFGIAPEFSDAHPAAGIQSVFMRLDHDRCHLSLDTSGDLLYRRGYKRQVTEAPLRETAAAQLLMAARFSEYDELIDPMCGSGTFTLEAASMTAGRLPGEGRSFPFLEWPSFREPAYRYLKRILSERPAAGCPQLFRASDRDPQALAATRANLDDAGLADRVLLEQRDILSEPPIPGDGTCLLTLNPPFGHRLNRGDSEGLYRSLGRLIRERYSACGYVIIVPGLELEKILSLTYDRKILFRHGGIGVAAIIRDAPLLKMQGENGV